MMWGELAVRAPPKTTVADLLCYLEAPLQA